jgi:hypothetical protein
MSNIASLKPFKKGFDERRNTTGANKGSISIMGEIKRIWADDPEGFKKWVKNAMEDKMLRREIIQQVDGKPVQPIAGVDGNPIVLKVIQYGTHGNNDTLPIQPETLST